MNNRINNRNIYKFNFKKKFVSGKKKLDYSKLFFNFFFDKVIIKIQIQID